MTYEGLARRYRPRVFSDVVGQQHVVKTLSMAIERKQWAPAYLFIGGRGLGKTSMARLLAKSLNCAQGPAPTPCGKCESCLEIAAGRDIDVLEIDAASHTGVDNVRDVIIQSVGTAPVRGNVRIFIIDEVHMLSNAAFNALLKTLEEPPANVVFILATTEGHKVPPTIRSRCQRFDFRPIRNEELVDRLREVSTKEKIKADAEALGLICEHAEGGMRDALSSLELVGSYAGDRKVDVKVVEEALGLAPAAAVTELLSKIEARDARGAIAVASRLQADGVDCGEVLRGLLGALRRELHAVVVENSGAFSRGRIVRSLEILMGTLDRIRYSRHPQIELELLVTRLAEVHDEEIMLREIYDRVVEDAGPPIIGPEKVPSDGAALEAEESGTLLQRIRSKLSPIPAALLESAALVEVPGKGYELRFASGLFRERFTKEKKYLFQTEELLSSELGGKTTLAVAGGTGAAGSAEPAPGTKRSVMEDPGVETIKRIFNTDVVEVIEE